MKIKVIFYAILINIFVYNNSFAICTGMVMNPITSVCWTCLFPISIGPIPVVPGDAPDTTNYPSPICTCPEKTLGIPVPGIAIGLWEPVRLIDVSRDPFCFVNLGGTSIPEAQIWTGRGNTSNARHNNEYTTWHLHYYIMPILYLMSIVLDVACLEVDGVDVAYLTELDPMWTDDELNFIINPEAAVFGNVIAQAACAADCLSASVWLPLDALFWCGGCQGSMYPTTGNIDADYGGVQTSLLATERLLYKLGRQGLALLTSTPLAICQPLPMPILKKSQYRTQMTFPIPMIYPTGCKPFGRSNVLYDMGKEIPGVGENFGYLIWRKRNCCVL
jgi:conjugal transfer pilus assembly protein TraU